MDEFPGNSRIRAERETPKVVPPEPVEKKVEQIITGSARARKKPLGKRFVETFFKGSAQGAARYVFFDVLLPAAQDAISDAIKQGVDSFLFGDKRTGTRTVNRSTMGGSNGYVSYNRFSDIRTGRREREEPRTISRRARSNHDFDEIVLDSRAEADRVLNHMFKRIELYDTCTLAELYTMVGLTPTFTDEKWGWTDIRDATVVRAGRDGYLLDLPKPEPLD